MGVGSKPQIWDRNAEAISPEIRQLSKLQSQPHGADAVAMPELPISTTYATRRASNKSGSLSSFWAGACVYAFMDSRSIFNADPSGYPKARHSDLKDQGQDTASQCNIVTVASFTALLGVDSLSSTLWRAFEPS